MYEKQQRDRKAALSAGIKRQLIMRQARQRAELDRISDWIARFDAARLRV